MTRPTEQREREELARVIDAHQMDSGSFSTPENTANAIIAAGWRKGG